MSSVGGRWWKGDLREHDCLLGLVHRYQSRNVGWCVVGVRPVWLGVLDDRPQVLVFGCIEGVPSAAPNGVGEGISDLERFPIFINFISLPPLPGLSCLAPMLGYVIVPPPFGHRTNPGLFGMGVYCLSDGGLNLFALLLEVSYFWAVCQVWQVLHPSVPIFLGLCQGVFVCQQPVMSYFLSGVFFPSFGPRTVHSIP